MEKSKLELNLSFLNNLTNENTTNKSNISNNSSIINSHRNISNNSSISENNELFNNLTSIKILKKTLKNKVILKYAKEIHNKNIKNSLNKNINILLNKIKKKNKTNINILSIHRRGKNRIYYNVNTYKYNEKIVKIYNYNDNPNIEAMIIKEIAFQMYANNLSECNFNVPIILNYGIKKLNYNNDNNIFNYDTVFFIEMEYLPYNTLYKFINRRNIDIKNICIILSKKINEIIECMKLNNIYHNDLHPNNILVNYENNNFTIYIIDFGEATNNMIKFNNNNYTCKKINSYIKPEIII
jgi:hypothetical protein